MSTHIHSAGAARVEVVDEWHRDWPRVLAFIDEAGKRSDLQLTPAGWVSARQAVLAAFDGDQVVSHLAFHIEPLVDAIESGGSQPTLQAKLDTCAVARGRDEQAICRSLRSAAIEWARRIHCDTRAVEPARVA